MFIVRFEFGGLIIALVPVIANRFGGKVAGYLTLVPIIMFLSFIAIYLTEGSKTTMQAAQAYLIGIPSVAISAIIILLFLKQGVNIYLTVLAALAIWFVAIEIIYKLSA